MDFEIKTKELENNYLKDRKGKKEFRHTTNKNFKLLPFVTKDSKIRGEKNSVKKDLTAFQGIASECYRMIHNQEKPDKKLLYKEEIIDKVLTKSQVKAEDKPQIETILNKVAFDTQGNLFIFDERIFSYINFQKPTGILENISLFFYTIFFDEKLKSKASKKTSQKSVSNIYYQLILSSLPEVKSNKNNHKGFDIYQNFVPEITEMFRQDLAFMLEDKSFFIAYSCFAH
ncbi:hypothetical protein [Microscilla marina]|uniref:Uncharacterized protein n=1 Tax=Microscilla marina ATCC 23134 TaxID=313606 RepID=A1ZVA4_MICM2|nr:hypothetical protein [Microscilla marina]EAY25602.1 hypothetical protein M23134_07253 [Microscilla marina ATCC 23134]